MDENNPPHLVPEIVVVNTNRYSNSTELSHRKAVQILKLPLNDSLQSIYDKPGTPVQPPTEDVVYEDENWGFGPNFNPILRQTVYRPKRLRENIIPRWRRLLRSDAAPCVITILICGIMVSN